MYTEILATGCKTGPRILAFLLCTWVPGGTGSTREPWERVDREVSYQITGSLGVLSPGSQHVWDSVPPMGLLTLYLAL